MEVKRVPNPLGKIRLLPHPVGRRRPGLRIPHRRYHICLPVYQLGVQRCQLPALAIAL